MTTAAATAAAGPQPRPRRHLAQRARRDASRPGARRAHLALEAGADGITVHLREDRRHIRDADVERLMAELAAPSEPRDGGDRGDGRRSPAGCGRTPSAWCPRSGQEVTTEGGLDAAGGGSALAEAVAALGAAGCRVSLFIDPEPAQLDAAAAVRRARGRAAHRHLLRGARPRQRRTASGCARRQRGRRRDSASNAMPGTG